MSERERMKIILLFVVLCQVLNVLGERTRPNIVLILNDDQDMQLGGLKPLRNTKRLLLKNGSSASNWFIHTPVCCPSRGEILTGRYFHNIRASNYDAKHTCMHVNTSKVNPYSFGTYLGKLNYTLGYFGKHMNVAPHAPPPGWDCVTCHWFANGGGSDVEPGGYLNATFSDFFGNSSSPVDEYHNNRSQYIANTNGEFSGYTTSIIGNKSIAWLNRIADSEKPFMLTVAPKAPHVPSTPASWYKNEYNNMSAPRDDEAYNASKEALSNHHGLISSQSPITIEQGNEIDELFRNRWRTLLSVDDLVTELYETIRTMNLLNSTYWIVTSDHGYNLGQHRLPSCKLNVYDHDTRIPLIISGPGISMNTKFDLLGSNVDVAPTMLSLAGASPDEISQHFDGKSILNVLDLDESVLLPWTRSSYVEHRENKTTWRDSHLIEYHSLGNVNRTGHLVDDNITNTYRALRFDKTSRYGDFLYVWCSSVHRKKKITRKFEHRYAEFTEISDWNFTNITFHEAFNMSDGTDMFQMRNVYKNLSTEVREAFASLVSEKWKCIGDTCI